MSTSGKLRCARCCMVVFDVFPQIMQDLMKDCNVPPAAIYHRIINNKEFMKKLNKEEIFIVQTLLSDGFTKLDVSLIYKIVKYFKIYIPEPSRKWGSNPQPDEIEIGDDVERIKKARIALLHKHKADMSEEEMDNFFAIFTDVGRRMDKHLNKKGLNGYEQTIQNYRELTLDEGTSEALQEIESLKAKKLEIHIYTGKNIVNIPAQIRQETEKSSVPVKFIINGESIGNITEHEEIESGKSSIIYSRISRSNMHNEIRSEQDDGTAQREIGHLHSEIDQFSVYQTGQMEKDYNFQHEPIIPDEIKKMGPESIQLYLKILQTGTERKRDIRVIIVGKKGSGKTSLTRRLLKEDENNIESTNGIEIHIKNSSIRLADGTWITQRDVQDTINSRLLKEVIVHSQKTAASSKADVQNPSRNKPMVESQELDKTFQAQHTEHKDDDRSAEINLDVIERDKISDEICFVREEIQSLDSKARDHLLNIMKSPIQKEEFANLFLWDFAGDEEFYNTHQIFLAKDVIYLILTKLDDFDDKQGAFKFWFDSVHCFCHSAVEDDVEGLDPPILVVGTHADKLNGETDCKSHMQKQIDKVAPRIKRHIRGKLVLSNTQDPDDKVDKLRKKILKIAMVGKNWNIELPLKFILLEQALQKHREMATPILSFDDIRRIASGTLQPITEQDEIELFLRYQHEIGNLIYFMDIPEYVVLNTQWLADAFRCIVTAEKYQYDLHIFEWKEVCSTGRLNGKLLDVIFAKQSRAVRDHKDYLVKLMEKFYILVRPRTLSETGVIEQNSEYYVPCLVKTMALKDLDQRFSVTAINSKSICFCLLFNFLPPMLFNHLLIAFCHKSDFRSATIKKDNNRCPAFFKDIAVFDISSNGCEKLLLAKYENAIQLQVWRYGSVQRRSYEDIRLYAIAEINKLTSERFRLANVRYEEKMKCARTQYDSLEGIRAYIKDTSVTEYYCEEHDEVESFTNDWFGKNSNEVLSAEQLNFTRIGIITLNILCDALYDRLKLDNANVPQRDKCDITFLYDFNRNKSQNKHIPNKPVKKLEKVEDIQTNHTNIGDDFERIRLIRNEMQHSKFFSLSDTRCEELFKVAKEILHRFDNVNNPGRSSYCDKADEIKRMTYTTNDHEDVTKRIQDQHHQHYTGDNMVVNNIFNCCGHTNTK